MNKKYFILLHNSISYLLCNCTLTKTQSRIGIWNIFVSIPCRNKILRFKFLSNGTLFTATYLSFMSASNFLLSRTKSSRIKETAN